MQDARIVGGWAAGAESRSPNVQEPRNAGAKNAGARECRSPGMQDPRFVEGRAAGAERGSPRVQEPTNAGTHECRCTRMQDPRNGTYSGENHLKGSDNWEAPNKLGNEAVGHEVGLLNFAKHLSQRLACTCCLHSPAQK